MSEIRELLFGDVPIRQWAGDGKAGPWKLFAQAADCLDRGDADTARGALREVLALPGLESRHYLQAWDVLRALAEQPPIAEAKHLYGVVIDMPVSGGWDTLAGYEDGSCRYLNFSGAAVLWETRDAQIDGLLEQLLAIGRQIVARIGPWQDARPPLAEGQLRLSFLCPSGLHFGQGPAAALASDPAAGALLNAGVSLLQALTSRTQNAD